MDKCKRCGKENAENYIAQYDVYLCSACTLKYLDGIDKFMKEFLKSTDDASDNGCTTCRYENLDCLDHPCNRCVHGIAGCKANMWEPR